MVLKMSREVKPKAQVEVPKVRKNIDQDLVLRTIRSRLEDVKKCYDQSLKKNADSEGRLKLSWFLDGSGDAIDIAELINDTEDPSVVDCARSAISGWRFPKGIILEVKYTFHLKSEIHERMGSRSVSGVPSEQ